LAGVLAAWGCSNAPSSSGTSLSNARQELTFSTTFDLEAYPELSPTNPVFGLPIACGSTQCFASYREAIGYDEPSLGTRITSAGALADTPRRVLARLGTPELAVPMGSDFIVLRAREFGIDRPALAFERIRGSDGASLGTSATGVASEVPLHLASDGSSLLLVTTTFAAGARAQVFDANLSPVGASIILATGTTGDNPSHVVAGNGQYLIVWPKQALRVSATTGATLDSARIAFAKYTNLNTAGRARGAYKDGTYQLAWMNSNNVYGTRIRASDGAVLDPDDDFNQLPGERLLCANCQQSGCVVPQCTGERVDADVVNGQVVLSISRYVDPALPTVHAFTVDVSTGVRPGGATSLPPAIVTLPDLPTHELHAVGSVAILQQQNRVYPLTPNAGAAGFSAGTPRDICLRSLDRTVTSAASNGSNYLVVFETEEGVFATRVNPTTGAYLDDPPLVIGSGRHGVVASDGSGYLVVWAASISGSSTTLGRALVTSAGTVTRLADLTENGRLSISFPGALRLQWNGSYYFLSWDGDPLLWGLRLTSAGAAVESSPILFTSTLQGLDIPTAAVGDTVPPADRRTFLVFYKSSGQVLARRLRSQTGSLISEITVLANEPYTATGGEMHAVTDGTRILLLYVPNSRMVRALFVDPVTGLPSGQPTSLFSIGNDRLTGAFYDGRSFVLLIHHDAMFVESHLRRFDANLASLDVAPGTPLGITGYVSFARPPTGSGRSLLAFTELDLPRFGMAARGRFLDNDAATGGGGSGGAAGGGNAGAGNAGASNAGTSNGGAGAGGAGNGGNGGAGNAGASNAGAGNAGASNAGTSNGGAGAGGAGNGGAGNASGGDSGSGNASGAGGATAGASAGAGVSGSTSGEAGAPSGGRDGTGGAQDGGTNEGGAPDQPDTENRSSADDSGGCGCRVGSSNGSAGGVALVSLLLAAACARRRRPRSVEAA
jgi:hypothetical protein